MRGMAALAGLLLAALVLSVAWIWPSTLAGETTLETVGEAQTMAWTSRQEPSKELEWTYTVELPERGAEVLPRLPVHLAIHGDGHGTASEPGMDLRVYFNGELAYRTVGSMQGEAKATGVEAIESAGIPLSASDLRQDALHAGTNQVRVVVGFFVDLERPGSQWYDARAGPVESSVIQADGDGDGVVDARQWSPVHTGWLALPAAIAGGLLGASAAGRIIHSRGAKTHGEA